MILSAPIDNPNIENGNLTEGLRPKYDNVQYVTQVDAPDFFVTEYPRCGIELSSISSQFALAYSYNLNYQSYSDNQADIINVSNKLFENSISMNSFQQEVLDRVFAESLLDKPTRPNRK